MTLNRTICVAPMMDWTDRHCRYFLRQISEHTVLYTEMVTAEAVLHGDTQRLLGFDELEQPVALQLGGSDPVSLAKAAKIGECLGYSEINLNVGCPSDRVQNGRFGVCLMAEPGLVANCVESMSDNVSIPVTVKTRIGIDNEDSYEFLADFVTRVASVGCETFIIHARKAWLKGLSPKQNREVPPLDYQRVYRLKQANPELEIILNGGVADLDSAETHIDTVNGVMLGRAAYHNAYILSSVDRRFYGSTKSMKSREKIVMDMQSYIETLIEHGQPLKRVARHMLGLYQGQPGARKWRRYLSENMNRPDADFKVLVEALGRLQDAA